MHCSSFISSAAAAGIKSPTFQKSEKQGTKIFGFSARKTIRSCRLAWLGLSGTGWMDEWVLPNPIPSRLDQGAHRRRPTFSATGKDRVCTYITVHVELYAQARKRNNKRSAEKMTWVEISFRRHCADWNVLYIKSIILDAMLRLLCLGALYRR